MKRRALLVAILASVAAAAHASPKPSASADAGAFGGADKGLIDRYTAALGDKYGFAPWAVEGGSLTAQTSAAAKTAVDISEARSEEEIEARILKTLEAQATKREFGTAKSPVYFFGVSAEDLFKGALIEAGATAADSTTAARVEENPFKALLDLRQGKISFPARTQLDIQFKINDKPVRRVILRRAADGASVIATLDGDDYAYVNARALAGGRGERDPLKAAGASVFFEMNAWMQKAIKAADAHAATANPRKLSDGGYRHPSFEKLMAQVRGGLTTENLDRTFENAGAQAPADLQARAREAQKLINSGYGGAARWKVNANGKYADADGNLTLLVRTKNPSSPEGKIEETPVVIKKDAHGRFDLASAVGPVTQLLLTGQASAAKAAAMKGAVTAQPALVAAEVVKQPALVAGPQMFGATGTTALVNAPAPANPDHALMSAADRLKAAAAQELKLRQDACDGQAECTKPAAVVRPAVVKPQNPPVPANAVCLLNMDNAATNADILGRAAQPLAEDHWARKAAGFSADGKTASAVGCFVMETRMPPPNTLRAEEVARNRLGSLSSCGAGTVQDADISHRATFRLKNSGWATCARAVLRLEPNKG